MVEGSVWLQWPDQHDGSFGKLRKLGESNHWADRQSVGRPIGQGVKTSTNEKLTIAPSAFEGFRIAILRHRTIQELHRGTAPPAKTCRSSPAVAQ